MRVLVADGQTTRRLGLRLLLDGDPSGEFEVVGEPSSGDETLKMAAELGPDLVLLDPAMGKADGGSNALWLCLALKLCGKARPPRIVLYGGGGEIPDGDARSFYEVSGAESFVEASEEPENLLDALRGTHRGERVCYGI